MKKYLALFVALLMMLAPMGALAEETGSELNVAVGGQFTTLDPAMNTETVNSYPMGLMHADLFDMDEAGKVTNELCESYTVSEDGLTWTFKLIDAQWSDGVAITAGDFVYSLLRTISYGTDNAWAANDMIEYIAGAEEYNLKAIEAGADFDCTVEDASSVGVKAIDDKTLEITLTKPCAYFTKMLNSYTWAPLRPDFAVQHDGSWAYEAGYPVSGAYILADCNENEHCIVTKNPNYFNADEVTMDTINFMCVPDQSAQAMNFQIEDIDVALSISTETALMYEGSEELWMVAQPSNYFLAINSGETGPEWAKNANLRRAVALAIDKAALVEVIGGEAMYPVLNGFVPYGLSDDNGSFREAGDADGYTLTYDPEQAKALLAQEGYDESNPLSITYKYSNNGMHGDVATMLQAMWQAVGINVTFDAVESGVFYDQVDNGDFEICRYGMTSGADPIGHLKLWITSKQIVPAVNDAEYDAMIEAASLITDPAEYYTALHAAEDYLCDNNVYVIPLFNYNTPMLVQEYVDGIRLLGGYSIDFTQATIAE